MKQNNLGIFLGGGGNKVFFDLGFVQELRRQKIIPKLLVGVSASSAIMFEEILENEGISLKNFGKRLKKNKKNFYFFSKNHFPHNDIYKNSIQKIIGTGKRLPKTNISWKILTSRTSKKFCKIKCIFSSIVLLMDKILIQKIFTKVFGIKRKIFSSKDNLSAKDIINIIMGSSTIYPFIQPHFYKNDLILEGSLINVNYSSLFQKNKKVLIINPCKGRTKIIKKYLHIFSSTKVPLNILDYTNENNIFDLYNQGRREAKFQLGIIKNYLQK